MIMSDVQELKNKMFEMRKKLITMEWDDKRNQLNEGRKVYYNKLREEFEKLEQELDTLEGNVKEVPKKEQGDNEFVMPIM